MKNILLYCLAGITLNACTSSHLIYGHDTSLGVDVAVSPEVGTGRMVLGYDRDTFAIVPRKGSNMDAMTLTSVGCVFVDGLTEINFNHFVSTGKAAINIAKSTTGLKRINDSIHGGLTKCK